MNNQSQNNDAKTKKDLFSFNTNSSNNSNSNIQNLEIDLRNFLLMLWRRKLLILLVMTLALGIVFYFVNSVQPRYTAKTLIMIENRIDPGPEFRALIANMRIDTTLILSEAEVLKSRSLAKKVIERLDLMNDPEFNPRLRVNKEQPIKAILNPKNSNQTGTNFKSLSVYKSESKTRTEFVERDMGIVIDKFLRGVYARPIPGSFVLQIEYTSQNASKSALIANAIVDTYIDSRLDKKFQATKKLSSWLDDRLETLREQVRQSEAAVEEYRDLNNLVSGPRTEINAQQLSELNSQLVLAKTKQAEAGARLQQIKNWITNPTSIETTSEALKSAIIQNLKISETTLLRKISDLSARYGEQHPKMINARAELAEIRTKLKTEMRVIAKGLESSKQVSQARVVALQGSINEIEDIRQVENKANIKLRELQREAESNRMIFDTFLETYKKSDNKEELQEAEARVISYATVPRFATYPNKPLFLSLAAAAAFFIGIALALLLEKLDNAFRTSSQLEEIGYPCFGVIPEAQKVKKKPIGDYILTKPASNIAEAVRTLRMILNLRSDSIEERPKVVTITSSLPGEGKTTLSSWMSRITAKSGERVIVIDCDLRRPNLHNAYGEKPDKTLVEYLIGEASLEEVIHKDKFSGAHVVFARSVPNNALDLISGDKMLKLIDSLKEEYDLVILDTPACLAVSDARVLAAQSDQTLFAVSWNDTPREVVNAGVKQFTDFGYDALAFVLTNVDIKKHSKYGYGDAVYYYSRYKEYYSN